MPKLGITNTIVRSHPRKQIVSAPTSLIFGPPNYTLYFSGLVKPDGGGYSGFHHDNAWGYYSPYGNYMSGSGVNNFGWNVYGGSNNWVFRGRALYDYGGFFMEQSIDACTNSAPAGDIPLTGWVNAAGITGTLVISTTPP